MSLVGPEPVSTSPLRRVAYEIATERRAQDPYPPGDVLPSLRRSHRMIADALGLLLDGYERHGSVFSLRLFHARHVFMLGPEANHFVLVSHADHFRWRDGAFGDLIPLLGDGMLTIDGDFHRHSRRIMLPAFHRERIAAAHGAIAAEVERAVAPWHEGARLDVYRWARELALRVALRALFGFDPDNRPPGLDPAAEFERALSFFGREYVLQILRGPRTPFAEMMAARRRLDALLYGEIARRRRSGERREDLLSLLLDARDEDGSALSEAHVRDHLMTMLFAGHDTTTATVAFLFYELARGPGWDGELAAERRALGREPDAADLTAGADGALPRLEQAIEETLRLYPPAWIGPRRAARAFAFRGHSIPRGALVNYSSWASHRLPDIWENPHAFRPERFGPEERKRIPRGAYVPFGGGSRICLGMRFGQLEIRTIAARVLRDFRLETAPGFRLAIRQTPTLGPRAGLPMVVKARE
jgi:cytochrome P450